MAAGVQLPFWPVWLAARGMDPQEIGTLLALGGLVRIVAVAGDRDASPTGSDGASRWSWRWPSCRSPRPRSYAPAQGFCGDPRRRHAQRGVLQHHASDGRQSCGAGRARACDRLRPRAAVGFALVHRHRRGRRAPSGARRRGCDPVAGARRAGADRRRRRRPARHSDGARAAPFRLAHAHARPELRPGAGDGQRAAGEPCRLLRFLDVALARRWAVGNVDRRAVGGGRDRRDRAVRRFDQADARPARPAAARRGGRCRALGGARHDRRGGRR